MFFIISSSSGYLISPTIPLSVKKYFFSFIALWSISIKYPPDISSSDISSISTLPFFTSI